jgi:hypothetical protein
MDGTTGSGAVGLQGSKWRRPPWGIPPGRKPTIWRAAPDAVVFGALMFSWVGGAALPFESRAYKVGYFAAVAVALTYGVTIIAFARRPKVKPVGRVGFTATPAATRWYGLAFVAAALLGLSIAFFLRPASAAAWDQARFAIAYWAAPCTYAACLAVARTRSNGAVKRAIVGGYAPIFTTSGVGGWWWDGSTWVNAIDAAPGSALRSPDGNYWWTGDAWLAMPPHRRRA